jgi:asparagine synthase (glutamine-hydrolysing)
MCGIVGLIGRDQKYSDASSRVAAMVGSIHHRGPDDSGLQAMPYTGKDVVFGNTRLAIIDVSAAGHMPMHNPDTGNWIAYNGEVYNFAEIRAELAELGVSFHSGTDTEVILKAYESWGPACVQKLRGMFAFAIWDRAKGEVFIARDRIGKKPLYYAHADDGTFVFGSEVRALLKSGLVAPKIDPVGLEIYLFNGFIVAPRTLVQGVRSLMPAHWMRVCADGRILESQRYWAPPPGIGDVTLTDKQRAERVDDIRHEMERAVALRLVSDVPLGAFLSGGLDSSAIVALMARATGDVRTFSITFDEVEFDESPYAQWVAERFSNHHTPVRISADTFIDWLPSALSGMDQPTLDGVNTYCVSRAARENGMTVALSGLGGDELFSGYSEFTNAPKYAWASKVANGVPGPIAKLVEDVTRQPTRVSGPLKLIELLHQKQPAGQAHHLLTMYQTLHMMLPNWTRNALMNGTAKAATGQTWFGLPQEFTDFFFHTDGHDTPQETISRAASMLFMAERTIRDTDMMSMAVSLEVRAPFVDYKLIESVWKVPTSIRGADTPMKAFEWELVRPYLGEDYPYRKKQGFTFPFQKWLRQRGFWEVVQNTLRNRELAKRIGLDPQAVVALADTYDAGKGPIHWTAIWTLFVLLRWCQQNEVTL